MKILSDKIDAKSQSGTAVLVPTSPDDFYVLSGIISPGDTIEAHTTRKLSRDGGRTQQKVSLKLTIRVETTEFDLQDGSMSVKGKICKENEFIQLGAYHTIHIHLDEKFNLMKSNWTHHSHRVLRDSAKEVPTFVFVIFYDRECVVSSSSSNGTSILTKAEVKNKNYKPLFTCILKLKDKIRGIIIGGFTSAADEFHKALVKEDKTLDKQTRVMKLGNEYKGLPNARVIGRMLVDRSLSKTFSEVKYIEDLRELGDFLESFDRGQKNACVGLTEIKEAVEYGAIKTFFILDSLYRPKTVEERRRVETLLKELSELRAKICVIPSDHELGERLKTIGGLAGVLTFTYK